MDATISKRPASGRRTWQTRTRRKSGSSRSRCRRSANGIVTRYAIGGAVGATFYLEPVATLDVDIFVTFREEPHAILVSPQPIFDYLVARGGRIEGEYVILHGWPVQFLPPTSPLVEEALVRFIEADVLQTTRFMDILARHDLAETWRKFEQTFLGDRG